MIKLIGVEPHVAKQNKPKVVMYGPAGTGKTMFALSFPQVYYIDTEGGASRERYQDILKKGGGSYVGVEQGALNFDVIINQVKALATQEHQFKTLVIDSVSKICDVYTQEEYDKITAKGGMYYGKATFGAEKKPAASKMKTLMSWLSRLDMNVILITHEKTRYEGGEAVGTMFDATAKLDYELDLVLKTVVQGKNYKAKVIKSRLDEFKNASLIDLSFDTFAHLYGEDIIERESDVVELASPEQLKELYNTIETQDVSIELQQKWLVAANCETFEEMDADKVSKIIAMYNKETK